MSPSSIALFFLFLFLVGVRAAKQAAARKEKGGPKKRKKKGEKKRASRPSFSLPELSYIHFSSTLPTHGAKKFPGLACSSSLDRERPASQARRVSKSPFAALAMGIAFPRLFAVLPS